MPWIAHLRTTHEEMMFKTNLFLAQAAIFFYRKYLCNFGKGHFGKYLCVVCASGSEGDVVLSCIHLKV